MSTTPYYNENGTFNVSSKKSNRIKRMIREQSSFTHTDFYNSVLKKSRAFIMVAIFMLITYAVSSQSQCYNFVLNDAKNPLQHFSVLSQKGSQPYFVDIDNDGDLDCFSGEYSGYSADAAKIYFYRNTGSNQHPVYKQLSNSENPLNNALMDITAQPYFADIDGDGDYDCFVADGNSGALKFYKNTGTAKSPLYEKQSAANNPLQMVKFYTNDMAEAAFADVDGDGDNDCVVSDLSGNIFYFKNAGTSKSPHFQIAAQASNPFNALQVKDDAKLSFYDWNRDGKIDLFVGAAYYENTGTAKKPVFSLNATSGPRFKENPSTPLRWVDLNNDGFVEAFTGSRSNGNFIYQTVSTEAHINLEGKQYIDRGNSLTLRAFPEGAGFTYQWKKDNAVIQGAHASELMVAAPGRYHAVVSSTCGEAVTNAADIIIRGENSSGLYAAGDLKNSLQMRTYPNPSKDEFVLTVPGSLNAQTVIRITDIQGRLITTQKANASLFRFGKELKSGVYFLQVLQNNKEMYNQKLIKE